MLEMHSVSLFGAKGNDRLFNRKRDRLIHVCSYQQETLKKAVLLSLLVQFIGKMVHQPFTLLPSGVSCRLWHRNRSDPSTGSCIAVSRPL